MTLLVARWEALDGYAVAHNMPDLRELDLGRLANFVYWRATHEGDDKGIEKFRARLWQPPRGVEADKRSPWSSENEASSFASARAALGLVDPKPAAPAASAAPTTYSGGQSRQRTTTVV